MLTPLLFEACSGRLELRHCAQPIRPALRRMRFLEARVERVDAVGCEVHGELTAFADDVLRHYPSIRRDELSFHLFEAGPRILPEIDPSLADVAERAAIPAPDGTTYPALAQHAVREGRRLAENIIAAVDGREPTPFVFRSLGTMASLGH